MRKTFTLVYQVAADEPVKIRPGLTEEDILDIIGGDFHSTDYAILTDTRVLKSFDQELEPDMMLKETSTSPFNIVRESVEQAITGYKPYSIRWKGYNAVILHEEVELIRVGGMTPQTITSIVDALNGAYSTGSQKALFEVRRVMKNYNL